MVTKPPQVVAVIQARLGSERLPMKALLPLPFNGGPPLLEHVVKRAGASSQVDTVVVATTDKASDDRIENFCRQHNIACFRGSADNVLERFALASVQYQAAIIVRLTGDNPFIQPSAVDLAVQKHIDSKVDYTITEGLPLGTNIEVISAGALAEAANTALAATDLEHVTPYIRRTQQFKRQHVVIESSLRHLRLTIDYPSDYALACLLYEKLYQPHAIFDLDAIATLLEEFPWLASINFLNSQKKVFHSEAEEIKEAVKLLKREGLTRALDRLIKAKHDF